jgi:DNA modification methylase
MEICTGLSPIGRVNEIIARSSGVSARQVSKIEEVLRKAEDGLKNRVLAGTTSVDKAFKKIKKQERRAELTVEALNNPIIGNLSAGTWLIHEDFIQKSKDISNNSIDLIFTDPPYDEKSIPLFEYLAKLASRVLKDNASLITYVPNAFIPNIINFMTNAGLTYWWTIAVQLEGSFARHYQRQIVIKHKPLVLFVKGDKSNAPEYISDLLHSKHPGKIAHDWEQSPIETEQCISSFTVVNQIVFDPMMGYATTGVAALKLKRKFIGIEIDEKHFRAAQLRMEKIALNSKVINS